jgi:hypothetical protein
VRVAAQRADEGQDRDDGEGDYEITTFGSDFTVTVRTRRLRAGIAT